MMEGSTSTHVAAEWDEEEIPRPDVSNLITEDDTPVDNQFSEKQMRLLTESIHASWQPGFPFVAMANVGVYVALNRSAIVPDVLLTTHVEPLQDLMNKEHRAYFSWMFDGKVPDVVIEIVSNTKGGELDAKLRNYQHMGVTWYAVFDPIHYLTDESLSVFALERSVYQPQTQAIFGELSLGLKLWVGEFEGVTHEWLRWCDRDGRILLTGQERADLLAARLRELGVDPDSVG
jgi:Uma2 family endonuclease